MIVQDIILVITVLGVMCVGLFVIKQLDRSIYKDNSPPEQEENEKESSYIVLTADMRDDELLKLIRTYESKHGNTYMALCQKDSKLYDQLFSERQ